MLTMRIKDDSAVITDTRQCAINRTTTLSGTDYQVYRICDHAPKAATVYEKSRELGIESDKVTDAIRRLEALRLLLRIDGRLISLSLREPYDKLGHPKDFPGIRSLLL